MGLLNSLGVGALTGALASITAAITPGATETAGASPAPPAGQAPSPSVPGTILGFPTRTVLLVSLAGLVGFLVLKKL